MSALSDSSVLQPQRSSLGARLVFWMVASSTLLSLVASGIQLYFSYQRDLSETQAVFDAIERNFESSLTAALWVFNFQQVDVVLDGLAANADVVSIDLVTTTGHQFRRRIDQPDGQSIVRSLALNRVGPAGALEHLGDLRIRITLAHIYERVLSQFWTLLLTNLVKTTLASGVMLVLFHVLVSKHLSNIAAFMGTLTPRGSSHPLNLSRGQPRLLDDLDIVVEAVNTAQARIGDAYGEVETLNRKLDASNLELQRTNHELKQFAHVAAHDLQEPLRKIRSFGDLLLEEYAPQLEGEGREYIEFMVDSATRQQTLVKDLLSYAQSDAADGVPVPVALDDVLQATLRELSLALEESEGRVEASGLPLVVANETHLRQIFANLIGNSLKYRSPERPPRISIRSEIQGRYCRIAFEDNGIGFAPQKAEAIFEPFKRLHARASYPGTGIGLAIVKKLVLSLGGSVTAEGRPGSGAVFTVTLPLANQERPAQ